MQDIIELIKSTPLYPHWCKIGIKHHSGFCLPLFSIRSKNSSGIGEFNDLMLLIDWCKKINMDIIQLLPLNEMSSHDPCPYNAISAFALDPIYISLSSLPFLEEDFELKRILSLLKKYNSSSRVKYSIREKKLRFLKRYFNLFYFRFKDSSPYQTFISSNGWLKPYAVFKTLKERFKESQWFDWPKELQSPSEEHLSKLFNENENEAIFFIFLQFLCFDQLSKVKNYATAKGVFLKGDLPILIRADSADVWAYSDIFDLNNVAGAPPDEFHKKGQKWGFPLLKWEELKKRNDFWWKDRLFAIKDIYHIYRIDHAVGFYRIWAIHPEEKAIDGRFLPLDNSCWKDLGEEHFRILIDSSPLLPIAEDLGTIPEFMGKSLKNLGICGTKIPRWQDMPLQKYDPLSLTTLSTPDTQTHAMWWKRYPIKARELCKLNDWEYSKKLTFDLRKKILKDTHHSGSLFHINLLQEYLALFPELVYRNIKKERINVPGTMSKKNWTYKLKISLEELTTNDKLIKVFNEITT